MDPRSSDALRRPAGLLDAPGPGTRPSVEAERRTRSDPTEPVEPGAPVCPAEVAARLAVLLRWM